MGVPRQDGAGERAFIAAESIVDWEYDEPAQGTSARVRWRTLVSADRTPSSGVAAGVFEVPPGAELAPHRHAPQEVYYVTSGAGEVFLDGAWRPAVPGDVVYVPGDHVHGARNRGDSVFRLLWVFPVDDYQGVEYEDADPEAAGA